MAAQVAQPDSNASGILVYRNQRNGLDKTEGVATIPFATEFIDRFDGVYGAIRHFGFFSPSPRNHCSGASCWWGSYANFADLDVIAPNAAYPPDWI